MILLRCAGAVMTFGTAVSLFRPSSLRGGDAGCVPGLGDWRRADMLGRCVGDGVDAEGCGSCEDGYEPGLGGS